MLDVKLKLESKLTTTKKEREHLQALLELAEAKSATTKTIRSLNDIDGVGDADIKRLGDSIRARLDREDAETLDIGVANTINIDRKSTRLNSSHQIISYAVFRFIKNK